jgi:hypothetical protein
VASKNTVPRRQRLFSDTFRWWKKDFAATHYGQDLAGFFSRLRPDRAPPPSRAAYASEKTGKVLKDTAQVLGKVVSRSARNV